MNKSSSCNSLLDWNLGAIVSILSSIWGFYCGFICFCFVCIRQTWSHATKVIKIFFLQSFFCWNHALWVKWLIAVRFQDFFQPSKHNILATESLLPYLSIKFVVGFFQFGMDLIDDRNNRVGNPRFSWPKKGFGNNLINLVKFFNSKDQEVALFDLFFFEKLTSFSNGVAVD